MSEIISETNTSVTLQKNVTDSVLEKINAIAGEGGLKLPEGYNPGNALKAAWLKLQTVKNKDNVSCGECCTKTSIVNALFDMCIQGISPAKNQCYFIVRGNELTMSRSYFGTVAALKRLKGVSDVFSQVIYKGDVFEYAIEDGNIVILKHEQKLENIKTSNIVGAYCVIIKDNKPRAEIMTWEMIQQSWSHTSGKGGVQKEFPDQMAKRTVLNRGAKMYINTSNDSDELIGAINRTTESEYEEEYQDHDPIYADPEPVTLPDPVSKSNTAQFASAPATAAVTQQESKKDRKPGF